MSSVRLSVSCTVLVFSGVTQPRFRADQKLTNSYNTMSYIENHMIVQYLYRHKSHLRRLTFCIIHSYYNDSQHLVTECNRVDKSLVL